MIILALIRITFQQMSSQFSGIMFLGKMTSIRCLIPFTLSKPWITQGIVNLLKPKISYLSIISQVSLKVITLAIKFTRTN